MTFLHLEDVSVAELLAQARDEADRVDVHADHLQPVLGVAGDLHRADPCRQRHLHVRTGTTVKQQQQCAWPAEAHGAGTKLAGVDS